MRFSYFLNIVGSVLKWLKLECNYKIYEVFQNCLKFTRQIIVPIYKLHGLLGTFLELHSVKAANSSNIKQDLLNRSFHKMLPDVCLPLAFFIIFLMSTFNPQFVVHNFHYIIVSENAMQMVCEILWATK